MPDVESSRFVTVFHQTKEHGSAKPGDRTVSLGRQLDTRYNFDEAEGDFIPVAKPIAVIDAGVELRKDELTEWCNSHAGKHVLSRYFPEIDVEDPTLPDAEEYLADGEADEEAVADD